MYPIGLGNTGILTDYAQKSSGILFKYKATKAMYSSFESQKLGSTSDKNPLTRFKHRCW